MLLFLRHCCRPQWSNSVPSTMPRQCALSAVVTFHATPLIVTRTTPIPGMENKENEKISSRKKLQAERFCYRELIYGHSQAVARLRIP
jgi:hypothetical protein